MASAVLISGRGSAKYPDKQAVINEIKRRVNEGLAVNYSAIRNEDDALRRRCTALFGGYKDAVEAAGYDYETFRVDTDKASYYGILFERLVKEMFEELRVPFVEEVRNGLHPDMILPHDRWVDVKLSEWTISNRDCETIERYLPHCRTLTVIYMRGRSGERMFDGKVRMINIDEITKQMPRSRRGYFSGEIDKLRTSLMEVELNKAS